MINKIIHNSSLINENSESFNFGVKDGVRGFYTSPSRADDSFVPFKTTGDLANFSESITTKYGSSGTTAYYPFALNGASKITYSTTKPANSGGVSLVITLYNNTHTKSYSLETITSARTINFDIPEGYDSGLIKYTGKHSGNASHSATATHKLTVICD